MLFYLAALLLVHDTEPNPGPLPRDSSDSTIFPCGYCKEPVTWAEKGVCCDSCEVRYHHTCQNLRSTIYEHMDTSSCSWHCLTCGMPNFGTTLFNTTEGLQLTGDDFETTDSSQHGSRTCSSFSFDTFTSPGPPLDMSSPIPQSQKSKKTTKKSIRLLSVNCQSVVNKRASFQNMVDSCNPDIVVATETWLRPDHADGEIGEAGKFSNEYKIHRRDRDKGRVGGGVFVAVRNDLESTRQEDLEEPDCELAWLKVDIQGTKSLYVGGYYRPHEGDTDSARHLCDSLSRICNHTQSHIWLAGDFNYPGIDWTDRTIKSECRHVTRHSEFLDTLDATPLEQIIQEPTREGNTLDLFLTSNKTLINRASVLPGISDHDAVFVESNITPKKLRQQRRQIPLWRKTDWTKLQDHISSLWNGVSDDLKARGSPNCLWEIFRDGLEKGIQLSVPHRTASRQDHHLWISRSLKRLIKKKRRLFTRKRKKPTRQNIAKYKQAQSQVQKKFRREYWDYVSNIMFPSEGQTDEDNDNRRKRDKKFYTYIKHCKKDSIGVAPLRDTTTGLMETDPLKKVSLLNSQFQSVFSLNTPLNLIHICSQFIRRNTPFSTPENLQQQQQYPTLPEFTISVNGVKKMLGTLKPHMAAGPDQIRPLILKELRDQIAPILQVICTRSYETGELPREWKSANVVPIYKKGSKHLPINYRPVSLTCLYSKIMEHILVSQISWHLDVHNILLRNQHGFRNGLSCETQLLEFVQELHESQHAGVQIDAVVMDFSKAFDKVAHNRLLYKLERYGIQGNALAWIRGFLTGRTQQVVLDGRTSRAVPVTSGVPQGSVLGPLLFVIYINDINTNITSDIRLFADDTIIYRMIHTTADTARLQDDINTLAKWSYDWQMEFHPAKCNVIRITRARKPIICEYKLYGSTLEAVSSTKYLGVNLTSDLRWNQHTQTVRNKAAGTLRFLQRNLQIGSTTIKTQAYNTYVRPLAEYAATVWDPHTKENVRKLEMVQRLGARWVLGRYHNRSSVTSMLEKLNWRSLEQRRADSRLAMLYKMANSLVAIDASPLLVPMEGIQHSAHPHRYVVPTTRTVLHQNSFFPRTIRQWNSLPSSVAQASSLDAFKHQVSRLQH